MDTRKILLADQSVSFCTALADVLGGACDLRICNNGPDACQLLQSFQPDILVIDLALPGMDGIAVLKDAASRGIHPIIMVTTRVISPYIESALQALEVDYLMLKPCNIPVMAERIHDMTLRAERKVFALPQNGDTVDNMLLSLNLSTKHGGFRFLEEAVILYEQNPGQSVTKILYPEVAKRCNASPEGVERAIRTAICAAWEQRDEQAWRMYFHQIKNGCVVKPTNTVFIATLADALRRQRNNRAQIGR